MKVLHIITSLGQGGAESALYELIKATHKTIDHNVVSLHDAGAYGPRLKKIGVNVETLGMPRGKLKFAGLWRLREIIRNYSPDLINTRLYHADLMGGVVSLFAGAPPVIWAIHSSDLGSLDKSWKTRFIRRICAILSYWIPSAIVTDSERAKKVHISLGYSPKKFIVINNGVDLFTFYRDKIAGQALRLELQVQGDQILLGLVARWDPLKDHSNFLQALSIIKSNNRKFICILVGKEMNSQNVALMELIRKNDLDEHVLLLGPSSDIPAIMNAIDLHVLSSSSESLPVAVIEAMACGTPCVVTDVGDARLITCDTGWVVPSKKPNALAAGIESAMEALEKNGKEALGKHCRRIIEEKYSLKVMADSYLKLWRDTLVGFESKATINTDASIVKVLHVIAGLDVGGAELALKRLVELHIRNPDYTHTVVSLKAVGLVGEQLREAGVDVVALEMNTPFRLLQGFVCLVTLIRRQRPDIVQTWMYHADLIGGLAARLAGCRKVIWGIRTTDIFPGKGVSRTTRWILKLCAILSNFIPHTILCVANRSKAVHAKKGYASSKMTVVSNGFEVKTYKLDLGIRQHIRESLNVSSDTLLIGSIGRFNYDKDHRSFITALATLASEDIKTCFLLVGRNIDFDNVDLMQWIEKTGYADRFKLLGERNDIPAILSAMDIFCLHSKTEGFPNVLGEAMCTSLPSVVTDVGDAGVLLGNAGLVVPPQDPERLAEALLTMIQYTSEARASLGNIALKRIKEHYSIESFQRQHEDLYQRVMIEKNIDEPTVAGFGYEWQRFDQSSLLPQESQKIFDSYFSVFPRQKLTADSIGFDLGCGSGRWAKLMAPRVGRLHCIDPSPALEVAKRNLAQNPNCEFHRSGVDAIPLDDESMDFGYALGVLHHIPNTQLALTACVNKIKIGAPFLVYLYYAFDNRPPWFRKIWKLSEVIRYFTCRLPYGLRYFVSQVIATILYFPFAKISSALEKSGMDVSNIPLSTYRHLTFYSMRTDAFDRFGTRLEQRFTKEQVQEMMETAGLEDIIFSEKEPYWCAVGTRKAITSIDN